MALTLPGFVNAHTHTFQRRLRGCAETAEQGDFWAWRERMIAEAETADAREPFAELRGGVPRDARRRVHGRRRVPLPRLGAALAAADAAEHAGIELVLLYVAYARGGSPVFRQPSVDKYLSLVETLRERGMRVGVAPHSVRACPRDWLEAIGAYAEREALPLHVHAYEQPREVEECLAEHGVRPVELLHETGCLGPHTTVIHATHASDGELDLIAEAGTRVCLCPTTEANLGDGFAPVERLLERGIGICIGSDSNVRIDPLEELREIEGIARRASGRRGVVPLDTLLCAGADEGAAALGLDEWPGIEIDTAHPSLQGIEGATCWPPSCSAAAPRWWPRELPLVGARRRARARHRGRIARGGLPEAAAALGELVAGDDMGGEPVSRTVALAAVTYGELLVLWLEALVFLVDTESVCARAVRRHRGAAGPRRDRDGPPGHAAGPREGGHGARPRVRARRRRVAGVRGARQKLGIR